MKQREIWKPVLGWEESYEVSNFGSVKSLHRKIIKTNSRLQTIKERFLKFEEDKHGYYKVRLCHKGVSKKYFVHRLVGYTFLGLIDKLVMNHLDSNRKNNHLNNLQVCTISENNKHTYSMGRLDRRGEKSGCAKLNDKFVREIKEMLACGLLSEAQIANSYKVGRKAINSIKLGKTWSHIQ